MVTTLQAISGAGYPGVASMDINANVIPFIGGEEEKMEPETQKILGDFVDGEFRPLAAKVSAHCNRVPVVDGHLCCVSVELEEKPGVDGAFARPSTASEAAAAEEPAQRAAAPASSIWSSRTVRSRAAMSSAKTAWPSSSAVCASARCSTTSSSPAATTPFAALPARRCSMPS